MSNIILGQMAKTNHGLRSKYDDSLGLSYKKFIDSLEEEMIRSVYDPNNTNDCIITMTCPLAISQETIDSGYSFGFYDALEGSVIKFCQLHDVSITISRTPASITITIDMKIHFIVKYI